MLSIAAPRRWTLLTALSLLVLVLAALAAPAEAGPRSSLQPSRVVLERVSATAPQVTVDGASTTFTYSVTMPLRTTLRGLQLRVRPTDGADAGKDVGKDIGRRTDLTFRGTRTWSATHTGLEGSWTAAVAWSLDGVTWKTGPPTSFTARAATPKTLFGTLQSSTERLASTTAAGVDLATFAVAWDRFEPVEGQVDVGYVAELRTSLAQYRAAGRQVVLDAGVHYPPSWLFAYPNSRYVDQYGDAYAHPEPGKKIANMVFNQQMRDKQARYLGQLLGALGTDFYGLRLGGGWYGELNYPDHVYAGRSNAYWGFDALARGAAPGLATGLQPNPVPDWLPGTPTADHDSARRFAEWYLASLDDYHDWQITTARRLFAGNLLMMYPSWGIRPGQLEGAVAGDLAGRTSVEVNGEVQRGFDVTRFVGGITDPRVVVYTTWLNADASSDGGSDARYWSPVKHLAGLAAAGRAQPLAVMGENTGRDTLPDLELTFAQARRYGLQAVVWAFEPDLYRSGYASIDDLATAIRAHRAG